MSHTNLQIAIAFQSLRASLNASPSTDAERQLNAMRLRYRTYLVPFTPNEGAIMLPKMFSHDFRSEISRFVNLTDQYGNQFEVLVDKVKENLYLTHGWSALRDFYGIHMGAWITLLYTGRGEFGIKISDRLHRLIPLPTFNPPMKFIINKIGISPSFVHDLPDSTYLLSYAHHSRFFNVMYQRAFTYDDIYTGVLMLPHDGFGKFIFDRIHSSIALVDDCGNMWKCQLEYATVPYNHYRLTDGWGRMVAARRLSVGDMFMIGVDSENCDGILYFALDR